MTADTAIRSNRGSLVIIRGTAYISMREAGRALSVSYATIYKARENGTLETVGLYKKAGRPRKNVPTTRAETVEKDFS